MNAREEAELTKHLDHCEECRTTLEELSADKASWVEASALLSNRGRDHDLGHDLKSDMKSLPLPVRQILDFLAPTDALKSLGRLDGFEILGVIGCGAMGVVLKAYDRPLDRVIALKVMHPSLAASGTARQRFAREAKAAAGVLHVNVVAIHGVSTKCSLPYLVMPYLKGSSLQQRIDSDGPLSLSEILRIGSQLAAGLAAAHEEGLIHRDIKPANIMLDDGIENVVITDFGLARTIDDATMTRSGAITGTPEFMSPEQARGESIAFSSDMFSLGSVLYVLCTGNPPFRAQTAFGVLRRITDEEPKAIRELNPEVPPWLCRLIQRLHVKQPGQRPTAVAAHALLQRCLAHVHQPDTISLPSGLSQIGPIGLFKKPLFRFLPIGVPVMILSIIFISLATGTLLGLSANDESTLKTDGSKAQKSSINEHATKDQPSVYKTITAEFASADQPRHLVIDINRGFVEVEGYDGQQVVIEIFNPPAATQNKSKDNKIQRTFAPDFDFDINKATNEIKLDTYNQSYPLNLRIKVPVQTNLDLDTYYLQRLFEGQKCDWSNSCS